VWSRIQKIIFSKVPSPFEASSLYWTDLIPVISGFLIRHFDIHLKLKESNFGLGMVVVLLPLILAIPVIDLWPKAYGEASEECTEAQTKRYKRSIRRRVLITVGIMLVLWIGIRQRISVM